METSFAAVKIIRGPACLAFYQKTRKQTTGPELKKGFKNILQKSPKRIGDAMRKVDKPHWT